MDNGISRIEFSKELSRLKKTTKFKECVHPDKKNCSKKIIKAHSIQNRRILNRLSKNGDVMQIDMKDLLFEKDLSKIGKGVATTFEGFCGKHDTEVFLPIESKDYEVSDSEQNFLFVYRIFAREYIVKNQVSELNKKQIEESGKVRHLPYMKIGYEKSLRDLKYYKAILDSALLKKDFNKIQTITLELSKAYPLAVSSAFGIEFDFRGSKMNDLDKLEEKLKFLFLTIFPQKDKTYCLLSCFDEDKSFFALLFEQLLNMGEEVKIQKLNILIAEYCENFVYSPDKWRQLHEEQKKEFIDIFEKTFELKEPGAMIRKPKFNLFF